jgi:hypothetical protein
MSHALVGRGLKALSKARNLFLAGLAVLCGFHEQARIRGEWTWECYGADGKLKWVEHYENLVVNQGLDELLNQTLAAQTQITTWYVGLKGTGSPAAADVPTSHAGWSEDVNYSESVRQTWTANGASSGQSVSNSSAKATFSINGSTTLYGAFLISNSTKSGTTGKFYAVGNFASSRAVISGDTVKVTATFTTADDGV